MRNAQRSGYSAGNDPDVLYAKGNDAARVGNSAEAIRLWGTARDQLATLAQQGSFVNSQGHSEMVPGFLRIEQLKGNISGNVKFFNDLAAQQQARTLGSNVFNELGDALARTKTGTATPAKAWAEGMGNSFGINSQALEGVKQSVELIKKNSIKSAQLEGQGSAANPQTDRAQAIQGQTLTSAELEPGTNQHILAGQKAAKIYQDMYARAAAVEASTWDNFDQAQFAVRWNAQHPNLMAQLMRQEMLTTPVRGIPRNDNAPIGTQFVAEPGSFPGVTGLAVIQRDDRGYIFVRHLR
jgi:hypothetical protein